MAKAEPKRFERYGMYWPVTIHPLSIELDCIKMGGQWTKKIGGTAGRGLLFHFKEFIRLVWPEVEQHRWFDFFLKEWLTHKYVGVMGPRDSGKTCGASLFHLVDWYCFPHCTTVLLCSTTTERLQDRIFGEIKKFHRLAKQRVDWLPGHLIEGRLRIIFDDADEISEGRDFRNGILGVPLKKGPANKGMEDFIGIKNKRLRLCGDEIQMLGAAFIDVTANLSGKEDFKCTGMGNPSETTDSLGRLCEPAANLGGWDSGIDQSPETKVWETRFPNGCCVQLPGSDTPNKDEPGEPKYRFLISTQQMEEAAKHWGRDDWHFSMFFEGRMPRGQGSCRVITRQLCHRGRAMDEPIWRDTNRVRIASLDSAFRAVGGDRCVFTRAEFGQEVAKGQHPGGLMVSNLMTQEQISVDGKNIFALIEQKVIPIGAGSMKGAALTIEEAEDEIVGFVMRECEMHRIPKENFFYDCGMKASLVGAFTRLWGTAANPVDFDGKPTERKVSRDIDVSCRDHYFNFVTEMWYSIRMCIDAGQFRGLTESVMMEGCKREFKRVGGNKIQVEPKKEMKEKTGESPDRFDSLAIAFEGARQRGFVIARLGEDLPEDETTQKWKADLMERGSKLWKSSALNYAG